MCVGLDPDLSRLPAGLASDDAERVTVFCREIADATAEFAAAFKLNSAFFERMGVPGIQALECTITYIKQAHPDRVVIVDAKRGTSTTRMSTTPRLSSTPGVPTW